MALGLVLAAAIATMAKADPALARAGLGDRQLANRVSSRASASASRAARATADGERPEHGTGAVAARPPRMPKRVRQRSRRKSGGVVGAVEEVAAHLDDFRENALHEAMRLGSYTRALSTLLVWNKELVIGILALATAVYLSWRRGWFDAIRNSRHAETAVTLALCLAYFVVSPCAILANKMLMKDAGFHFPIIVSSLGQAFTACAAFVCLRVLKTHPMPERHPPAPPRTLLAVGCASALSLCLGQYPYLYLTVAFIQMLKAFSPAYIVIALWAFGVEYPSRRIIGTVIGLSVCAAVASAGEAHFHAVGVGFMVAAAMADAIRLVLTQMLMQNIRLSPMVSLLYVSPACLVWTTPAILALEMRPVISEGALAILAARPALTLASAVSGFGVNITSFYLVKRTSSMSLKTMTMARNAGLVLISALAMGEQVTGLELAGYSGLIGFFGLYTYLKAAAPPADAAARQQLNPALSRESSSGSSRTALCEKPGGGCNGSPSPLCSASGPTSADVELAERDGRGAFR